jgi:hypothetical protein
MAATSARPVQTDLKPEALDLSVTMQAITHIAPAIAALFFTQFLVTLAGLTAPLAYAAGVIVLMLGNTLIQFSRHLPPRGYYTYVSRSLARAPASHVLMFILTRPWQAGRLWLLRFHRVR